MPAAFSLTVRFQEDRGLAISRRRFLQHGGVAAITAAMRRNGSAFLSQKWPPPKFRTQLNVSSLAQFVDPLPIPDIAKPSGLRPSPVDPRVKLPYYRIPMRQFEGQVHRDLKPTRMWGFGASTPGPTLETRSGQGLLVEWINELPRAHFLPIDHSIHGAEADKPEVRTVVHLHGGKAPPESDGYPEKWFVPGESAVCHYPNRQDAAMLWYHDHALGINRLNVFAGLLGVFFVRDEFDDSLELPRGKYEIPLVLYDRIFDLEGQLNYPVSGDSKKPWTPEVFGDAILVNGKLFPYLEVEPRKYRFRVLNGANASFFHLALSNGQPIYQIGTDQGLLSVPVRLERVNLAPAERADLILDFAAAGGQNIVMTNGAFSVMQFRVSSGKGQDATVLPSHLRPVSKIEESTAVKTRMLSLVEVDDPVQRPMTVLLNNTHWNMPVTESPELGSTEIWGFVNTTDDAHPLHLHLVRFQILDRRRFDVGAYWTKGEVRYTGPAMAPEPGEAGWKDTVRADPGMVTRIITRFEGFPGRYVWHCHILEHEDNEMMRPFDVIAAR